MSDNARRLFVQAAAIKAVKEAVLLAEEKVKTEIKGVTNAGDRLTAALEDGISLATVSRSKTGPKAEVTDPTAFTQWVVANHPSEIEHPMRIDAALLVALTGDPDLDGWRDAYDAVFTAARAAAPRVRTSYERAVLADVVKAKAAVDTTTGEEIPGVTFFKGGEAGYVTVRQSEDQLEATMEAYHRGDLDLLALAITAPADLAVEA